MQRDHKKKIANYVRETILIITYQSGCVTAAQVEPQVCLAPRVAWCPGQMSGGESWYFSLRIPGSVRHMMPQILGTHSLL